MPTIIDNCRDRSPRSYCRVFYRSGDGPWHGGYAAIPLARIREDLAENERTGRWKYDTYRIEPAERKPMSEETKAQLKEIQQERRSLRRKRSPSGGPTITAPLPPRAVSAQAGESPETTTLKASPFLYSRLR